MREDVASTGERGGVGGDEALARAAITRMARRQRKVRRGRMVGMVWMVRKRWRAKRWSW